MNTPVPKKRSGSYHTWLEDVSVEEAYSIIWEYVYDEDGVVVYSKLEDMRNAIAAIATVYIYNSLIDAVRKYSGFRRKKYSSSNFFVVAQPVPERNRFDDDDLCGAYSCNLSPSSNAFYELIEKRFNVPRGSVAHHFKPRPNNEDELWRTVEAVVLKQYHNILPSALERSGITVAYIEEKSRLDIRDRTFKCVFEPHNPLYGFHRIIKSLDQRKCGVFVVPSDQIYQAQYAAAFLEMSETVPEGIDALILIGSRDTVNCYQQIDRILSHENALFLMDINNNFAFKDHSPCMSNPFPFMMDNASRRAGYRFTGDLLDAEPIAETYRQYRSVCDMMALAGKIENLHRITPHDGTSKFALNMGRDGYTGTADAKQIYRFLTGNELDMPEKMMPLTEHQNKALIFAAEHDCRLCDTSLICQLATTLLPERIQNEVHEDRSIATEDISSIIAWMEKHFDIASFRSMLDAYHSGVPLEDILA